jgi:hypothetical protein
LGPFATAQVPGLGEDGMVNGIIMGEYWDNRITMVIIEV